MKCRFEMQNGFQMSLEIPDCNQHMRWKTRVETPLSPFVIGAEKNAVDSAACCDFVSYRTYGGRCWRSKIELRNVRGLTEGVRGLKLSGAGRAREGACRPRSICVNGTTKGVGYPGAWAGGRQPNVETQQERG